MRQFQTTMFLLGTAVFLASAGFHRSPMGDTLWKTGIAVMVGDIVCILLWPRKPAQ